MEKTIAIISIATGKYNTFIPKLKKSIDKNFLPNYKKSVFICTDNQTGTSDIYEHHINHLPWPLNTLLRFHYFIELKEKIKKFDYVYYMDADTIVHSEIDEEIIPKSNEIVIPLHWHYQHSIGPYEFDQKQSTAYINPMEKNLIKKYSQACFFGTNSYTFLYMSHILRNNIEMDLKKNIISRWHDESHLNKYILNNPCKQLHSGYCYSQNHGQLNPNVNIKIIHTEHHSS
jgi:hypothetical protein